MRRKIRAVIRRASFVGGVRRGKSFLAQCDVDDIPGGKKLGTFPGMVLYVVEYTLSETGRYNVIPPHEGNYCVASVSDRKGGKKWPVCFLPEKWWGKRVDREVIPRG